MPPETTAAPDALQPISESPSPAVEVSAPEPAPNNLGSTPAPAEAAPATNGSNTAQ